VLGVSLLALAVSSDIPLWDTGLYYFFGVVALVTGAVGFCPGWEVLGINTCRMQGVKRRRT
jgi:hypothetical protein